MNATNTSVLLPGFPNRNNPTPAPTNSNAEGQELNHTVSIQFHLKPVLVQLLSCTCPEVGVDFPVRLRLRMTRGNPNATT